MVDARRDGAPAVLLGAPGPGAGTEDCHGLAERNDPERKAEDGLLAAASWPPPGLFDRETSLSLIRGAAAAKAARIPAFDDSGRRERERWQQANEYSTGLAGWMAANRAR